MDCLACNEHGPRKRLRKALDNLTYRWMAGNLPDSARWLLDTELFWVSKEKQGVELDDDTAWLVEADNCDKFSEVNQEIIQGAGDKDDAMSTDTLDDGGTELERPKVRPIQMGEMLRKFVCKRALSLERPQILRIMTSMRQYGCGTPGGTEAIIHLRKHLQSLWDKGLLPQPLAIVEIDQKNFFGSLNWRAIREETAETLPRRAAATTWKHLAASNIHQPLAQDHKMSHGTGQGDVDAGVEASLVQGRVARETRARVHLDQRNGRLPWTCRAGENEPAQADFDFRLRRLTAFNRKSPAERAVAGPGGSSLTNPRDEIQKNGGIVDAWYLDDGTVISDPRLVVPFLSHFQEVDAEAGTELNQDKSKIRLYASAAQTQEHADEWQLDKMKSAAVMDEPDVASISLGAEVGGQSFADGQMREKSQVVEQMARRIQCCQDPQVELTLTRACLGVSKVNHLLRANGTELVMESTGLKKFDEVQAQSVRRLVPGLDAQGEEQAFRAMGFGGLGLRKALYTALPAHLASLIVAGPKLLDLAENLEHAGLLPAELVMSEHRKAIETARQLLEERLDAQAKVALDNFLEGAKVRAASDWFDIKHGAAPCRTQAPRAEESRSGTSQPGVLAQAISGGLRDEPDEMGQSMAGTTVSTAHVQRELTYIIEAKEHAEFMDRISTDDDRAHRRMLELCSVGVCVTNGFGF